MKKLLFVFAVASLILAACGAGATTATSTPVVVPSSNPTQQDLMTTTAQPDTSTSTPSPLPVVITASPTPTLPGPCVEFTGYHDLVIDQDGQLIIADHKTMTQGLIPLLNGLAGVVTHVNFSGYGDTWGYKATISDNSTDTILSVGINAAGTDKPALNWRTSSGTKLNVKSDWVRVESNTIPWTGALELLKALDEGKVCPLNGSVGPLWYEGDYSISLMK